MIKEEFGQSSHMIDQDDDGIQSAVVSCVVPNNNDNFLVRY